MDDASDGEGSSFEVNVDDRPSEDGGTSEGGCPWDDEGSPGAKVETDDARISEGEGSPGAEIETDDGLTSEGVLEELGGPSPVVAGGSTSFEGVDDTTGDVTEVGESLDSSSLETTTGVVVGLGGASLVTSAAVLVWFDQACRRCMKGMCLGPSASLC